MNTDIEEKERILWWNGAHQVNQRQEVNQHQILGGRRENGHYVQPLLQAIVVTARCKSDAVRSKKHGNKPPSSEDIQQ